MTRILLCGDAGATGFGTVTRDLGQALLDRGDDIRFLSFNEDAVPDDQEQMEEPLRGRTRLIGVKGGWLGFAGSEEEALEIVAKIEGMFGPWDDGWEPEACIAIGDAASFLGSPVADVLPAHIP